MAVTMAEAQRMQFIAECRFNNLKHTVETCDPSEFWAYMSQLDDARQRLIAANWGVYEVQDRQAKEHLRQIKERDKAEEERVQRRREENMRKLKEKGVEGPWTK